MKKKIIIGLILGFLIFGMAFFYFALAILGGVLLLAYWLAKKLLFAAQTKQQPQKRSRGPKKMKDVSPK